jgi:hypothetical protein
MNSRDIDGIFASRGARRGSALLLDERSTLALIEVAQQHDVAVAGIELYRPAEDGAHLLRAGATLGLAVDRAESWRQAREFVGYLTGRGATFEVLLETPQATQRARLRDGGDARVEFGFWRPHFTTLFLPLVVVVAMIIVLFTMAGG